MAITPEQLGQTVYVMPNPGMRENGMGTITPETGDFLGKDHSEILSYINYAAALSIAHARTNGFENPVDSVLATINKLEEDRINYANYINNPENYKPNAEARIIERYATVDASTVGLSPRDRLIARINSGAGIIYCTDKDGTLTHDPETYLYKIPGSGKTGDGLAEDLLGEIGRDNFTAVYAQVWQPILQAAPDIFRAAGRNAQPLTGTRELFQYLKQQEIPIIIDSANFHPVVDEFVKTHLPEVHNYAHIVAIKPDSIISTDKGNVLRHVALSFPEYTVLHAGDSTSDEASLSAEPVLGGYLARAGLGFEGVLQQRSSLYVPYKTHYDTLALLQEAEAAKAR